jgi:Domain of unknown function (DUF5753)
MTMRDNDEARRFFELLKARQELLSRQPPVKLWTVLDQAVLRRQVGGPAVMRAQLDHLAGTAELPHVTPQVLPEETGEHAALEGSFTIVGFPEPADPDVVYLDAATGGVYLEKPEDRERYAASPIVAT